jgi:hypothetical protein
MTTSADHPHATRVAAGPPPGVASAVGNEGT